jgi:Bacterial transcriptional activator domain
VGELEMLTTRYPLRERLWEQRMLALYQLLQGVLRLTGPVLLGLALLALRSRVKR